VRQAHVSLHPVCVFAMMTLGQIAELLNTEVSGRRLGHPALGRGAQAGGALATAGCLFGAGSAPGAPPVMSLAA
jgi:hypothetical protein